jgi:hypothetical protein
MTVTEMPGYFRVKMRPMSSAASPLICAVYQVTEPSLCAASSIAAISAYASVAHNATAADALIPAMVPRRVKNPAMAFPFG